MEKEKENCKEAQEKLNKEIETLDKENEELGKIIEEFSNLNKDNQKYIDDLNFDITNLKISVSSFDESEVSINEMVERIDLDIQNNQTSIESKKEIREKILLDNKALEEKIESMLVYYKVKSIEDMLYEDAEEVIKRKS